MEQNNIKKIVHFSDVSFFVTSVSLVLFSKSFLIDCVKPIKMKFSNELFVIPK